MCVRVYLSLGFVEIFASFVLFGCFESVGLVISGGSEGMIKKEGGELLYPSGVPTMRTFDVL